MEDIIIENEKYDNNICIIGKNIDKIKKKLGLFKNKEKNKLENKWNIFTYNILNDEDNENVFNKIITNINEIKDKSEYSNLNKIFSYTIIYSLNKIKNNNNVKGNIRNLLEKISSIDSVYYHPFIILLAENEKDKDEINLYLNSVIVKEIKIDKRNIECFVTPLNAKILEKDIELIKRKIYKIFSYFFEMGDEFIYKDNMFKLYEETKEKLFSINILVLGKTQVGKSTFINSLLKEKKAKEGGEGSSETKEQKSYHLDNVPLIINDIEGITGEETINKVVEKINTMQKNLEETELHLVIYAIDFLGPTYFNENEYKIFKQLSNRLDSTQFIFLCSKSKSENDSKVIEKIKKSFYKMLQNGLRKDKDKDNIMNVLNYLYLCQKKDIDYCEIDKETNITKEDFIKLNLYEKLELKFKNYTEEMKNKEMIDKIIEENNNLIFTNLKLDDDHTKIFGMNKVSQKIREALLNIKNNNMMFFNERIKFNKESKIELDKKICYYKKLLEENKDIKDFIDSDHDINEIRKGEIEEAESLLNNSINELNSLESKNQIYVDLINSINEKKY